MNRLLAIDPANIRTAYVLLTEDFQIIDKGILYNEDFILMLKEGNYDAIAAEIIVSYGLRVGESVFSTAEMIGRITQVAKDIGKPISRVRRPDVSRHFKVKRNQGSPDTQIAKSLRERFAAQPDKNYGKGTKKDPDYFYGFAADVWQAMAVGVYALDSNK